ncbi:ABC transporter substrate-binding protein [Tessaracoccus rhinocerotis]|uniref:ABC transporter substrate-binding protein n=1 Tax=Tessaracoccus rhinocerotis TaxID=1689449 RepID=A0A553K4P7_9ACTN|nr:ABC transporter substrate-binding protein [Tessaracoccus rhinocerotis]TRY19680.1 ABC transporter substrate-binding protein [Tessaracoccus rhinocerotis]
MRNISRRGFLGSSLAVGTAAGLTACGGQSMQQDPVDTSAPQTTSTGDGGSAGYDGPNVELQFWNGFTGGDGAFMKTLVDQFNEENANIAVSVRTLQWADYYDTLPTAVQAGRGPDIGVMHVDSVATNAAREIIQPLDDVASALELTADDFAPVPWEAGLYQDVRYSIPLDVHPLGFFYNKTVMEQAGLDPENPPMDLDSYMDALDKLKSAGIQGHWTSPFPFTGGLTMQSLLWQFGGDLFNADATEAVWAEAPGVEAFTWWQNLAKDGHSPQEVAQDADFIALQNGQTAFNWNGIWSINTLKEKTDLEWGVKRLPNIGGTPAAWAGSHQFVLPVRPSPDEDKDQASRVFLNWISEQSLEWAKGGQVPARNSVRESAEFQELTDQAELAGQIDDLHFLPAVPGIGDAMVEWDKALNEITLAGKDVAATLDQSVERANKILEDNAKRYG